VTLGRYALVIIAILAVTLSGSGVVLAGRHSPRALLAVLFGALVAALNSLLAHAIMRWSDDRPTGEFVKLVLGGMAARMVLVLAAVAAGVTVLALSRLPLLLSLLIHFGVFLAVEMVVVSRHRGTAMAR
jgi:hypothetical protein